MALSAVVPESDLPNDNLDVIIGRAARKHGIDPSILRAVGMQESGLGRSSAYDPATGLSRTKGNAGHGIWQLDPASGASADSLKKAARDPAFAADYAAGMLSRLIKLNGGNVSAALSSYNAGNPNSTIGQAYARSVLGFLPEPQQHPAIMQGKRELAVDKVTPGKPPHSYLQKLDRRVSENAVPASDLPDSIVPKSDLPASLVPASDLPRHSTGAPKTSSRNIKQVPQAKTTAGRQGVGILPSLAQRAASWLDQHGQRPLAHGLRVASDTANNPLGALNAILGAPQRAISGGIANYPHNLREAVSEFNQDVNAMTGGGGSGGPGFRAAVYGALHPNDLNVQAAAQKRIGWDRLHLNKPPQGLEPIHQAMLGFAATASEPTQRGMGLVGAALADPKNIQKVANAISDMSFQTITDPLTYLGGAGVIRNQVAAPIEKFASHLGARGLSSQNKYVRSILATFIPNPKERVALTPQGQAAVSGIRNAETGAYARRAHTYSELLSQHANEIRNQKVPTEIEQELLRQGYRYGTPELRDETLAAGFNPTEQDMQFNDGVPAGVLNYHLREDYFPHMRQYSLPEPLREIGEAYDIPKPAAGFEKPQEGTRVLDPLGSMTYRLAAGNAAIRHRMMQARMSSELGLPYRYPWAEKLPEVDQSRIDSNVVDTAKAYDILDKPLGDQVERMEWLQPISNVGRDVLIGANPVPHAKNISVLATLAGGVPGFVRGLRYAIGGVPSDLERRLMEGGGATHFMLTDPAKFSPVRVLPQVYRKRVVQNSLDRIDMGMRAARLAQIDKEYGNTLTEFQKMQKVNEDIGAYHDSPAYVRILRDFGGQFPQWHGYIVPTAVGRAMLRDPQRIETWIRAQDATNKNIVNGDQNQGYNIEFGGPVTEFGEFANTPAQLANKQIPTWLVSPSMTGPVGSYIAHATSQPQNFGGPTDLWSQVIPYYNIVAPQFGVNPYGSKAPPNVRSLAAFFGAYPKAEQSVREKMIRDFMERGLDRFHADQRVKRLFQLIRGR